MTNEDFLRSISLEGEIWKDVVGYEGLYAVSNLSRIASIPRYHASGRILKLSLSSDGYYCVCLRKEGISKKEYLHRIVAQSWIPNPNNYPQIDHIDGCRTNSAISNLRWCTLAMNQNYPIAKLNKSLSIRRDKTKSIEIVCLQSDKLIKIYPKLSRVNDDGYFMQSVWKCIKGKQKTHKGYTWMYLSDYEASYQ